MLKPYIVKYYYRINDGKWEKLDGNGERLEDRDGLPDEEMIWEHWKWQEIMDYLLEHNTPDFHRDSTVFRHIPYFYCSDYYECYITKFFFGDFDTFSYKKVYIENEYITLDNIMKKYPAEKCVQYLKERGMAICPMNNVK
jgi:hypothetical protein